MDGLEKLWCGTVPAGTETLPLFPGRRTMLLAEPDDTYIFLHDPAITAWKGTLFTAWYNCTGGEMIGRSVIRGRISSDRGKTWSGLRIWAQDPRWLFVPPAFASLEEGLFLLVNRMTGPDELHDLLIFRWNGESFEPFQTVSLPFLVNCSVLRLSDGRLICGGRRSRAAGQKPEIPAVLIADSGKMEGPWRIVDIHPSETLPDGSRFRFPETGLAADGADVVAFVRNDSGDRPILFRSSDRGDHWSGPVYHDLPTAQKKIAAGTLSDGRMYVIANPIDCGEWTSLFLAVAENVRSPFRKAWLVYKGKDPAVPPGPPWNYPAAVEMEGNLYIICSAATKGAALAVLPTREMT